MCFANLETLTGFIKENLGEPKYLSEWKQEFNSRMPTTKRLTEREMSFAFRVIHKKGLLEMENPKNLVYCFH